MTCSQCQCEFCWLCLQRTDVHLEAHECNRYDPTANAVDGEKLKRDLFYTERFQAHEQAELFAKRHSDQAEEAIQKLVDRMYGLEQHQTDQLLDARETLVQCRRFLKHSYVAAYNMQSSHQEMFVDQQGALESFCEMLSFLSETNLERVYVEDGEKAIWNHLKSLSFYTVSVKKYMDRIVAFTESLQ